MRHVGTGHEEVLMADAGSMVLFFGAPADGHPFTEDILVADLQGVGAAVTDVLRLAADHRIWKKPVPFAHGRVANDRDMILKLAAVPQSDVGADVAKGPDIDVLAQLGPGVDVLNARF